jgi:hypothetical protein
MNNFKRMQIRAFEEATGWDRGILARGRQSTEKGRCYFHDNGTLRTVEQGLIYGCRELSHFIKAVV